MLCEKCKQREATVHKQAIVNGVSHSEHLCSECAAKENNSFWNTGFDQFFNNFNNDFFSDQSLGNWFQPFFQSMSNTMPTKQLGKVDACPHCGMTWEEFQRNGLLGCSECYDHFANVLPPLLRRLHGQSEHIGKKPQNQGAAGETTQKQAEKPAEKPAMTEKEKLQQAMREAVETENFEEAARLRDQIKALDKKEDE